MLKDEIENKLILKKSKKDQSQLMQTTETRDHDYEVETFNIEGRKKKAKCSIKKC